MITHEQLDKMLNNRMTPGMVWPVDEMLDTLDHLFNENEELKTTLNLLESYANSRLSRLEAVARAARLLLQDARCDAGCWSGMDPCGHRMIANALKELDKL